MIEVMDRGIGELMVELDRLKGREKTLAIFASDNRPDPISGTRFNAGLRGMKYVITRGRHPRAARFQLAGDVQGGRAQRD